MRGCPSKHFEYSRCRQIIRTCILHLVSDVTTTDTWKIPSLKVSTSIFQRGPVVETETEMSISRMTVAMLCHADAAELPSSRIAACGAPLARVGNL